MRGLVGRKVGMTRLFDEESGAVTPVTVIEAGPCPVVAVRTPDADGYEGVQLAFEPVADRKISKAERGHLEKNVYCVIRSPFKDKDSREHFEVRTHKRLIDIHSPTPKTVDSLMRLDLPAGVDIEIKL